MNQIRHEARLLARSCVVLRAKRQILSGIVDNQRMPETVRIAAENAATCADSALSAIKGFIDAIKWMASELEEQEASQQCLPTSSPSKRSRRT